MRFQVKHIPKENWHEEWWCVVFTFPDSYDDIDDLRETLVAKFFGEKAKELAQDYADYRNKSI